MRQGEIACENLARSARCHGGCLYRFEAHTFGAKSRWLDVAAAADPAAGSPSTSAQVRLASGIAEPIESRADVNDDGIVNIQDLVRVANNMGQQGQIRADVKRRRRGKYLESRCRC